MRSQYGWFNGELTVYQAKLVDGLVCREQVSRVGQACDFLHHLHEGELLERLIVKQRVVQIKEEKFVPQGVRGDE